VTSPTTYPDLAGRVTLSTHKGRSTKVIAAEPATVRAAILAQMVEANGRPVAYVLVENANNLPADGAWVNVEQPLLDQTLNSTRL
jgi:hypothetical protein